MDHLSILKRSWQILWRYRALWFFGVLLAITSASIRSPGGSGSGYSFDRNNWNNFLQQPNNLIPSQMQDYLDKTGETIGGWFSQGIPGKVEGVIITSAIVLICLGLIVGVASAVLRYLSTISLIRMVDKYEENEERVRVSGGFRLGWSRATWRIFLIDLVINIPITLAFIFLFTLAFAPLLLWLTKNTIVGILGTVTTIGLFFLLILVAILVNVVLSVLRQFFQRACALQGLGVFDSIRAGYRLAMRNWKDSALMWLILLGIQIAYNIGNIIAFFVLSIPALVVAGAVGLVMGGIGNIITHGPFAWILGIGSAAPFYFIIIAIPLLFFAGLCTVYFSSAWTLTFRELSIKTPLEKVEKSVTDQPELPELTLPAKGETDNEPENTDAEPEEDTSRENPQEEG